MPNTAVHHLPEFATYQELLKFVVHHLNILYSTPLTRLSQYSGISVCRIEEARKVREDRKQTELTYAEHVRLACTCFELEAPELGLLLLRWGVEQYVRVEQHAFDRAEIREKLAEAANILKQVQESV